MQAISQREPIGALWKSIQSWLFPVLEDELGELDDKHRQFVAVCELCAPQDHMTSDQWCGNGCPPSDRLALCKAYIAKAVWDFATTRDLIDALRHRPALRRLCGWESLGNVPSESTFSRAFGQFARDERAQAIHAALIKTHYGEKIAGHISRDATAIHAREKAEAKPKQTPETKGGKRAHRRKDTPANPPPEPKRMQQQLERDLETNLADAAYDAKEIREMSARLGHVPIIDDNPRRGVKREFSPAEAVRYHERSAVERVNSHLHEQHGGRHVRVRGSVKVAAHLSFGLLVIAAEQMLRMLV